MSMNGYFKHVSPRVLACVLEDPALTQAVLDHDSGAVAGADSAIPPSIRQTFSSAPPEVREALLAGFKEQLSKTGLGGTFADAAESASEALAAKGIGAADIAEELSIDKAWHGLHYLLAHTRWEPTAAPGNIVLGGVEVGEDAGYGPARYLTAAEVSEASSALARVDEASLRESFNPTEMIDAEIYGGDWDDPEELDYLLLAFARVRSYFQQAADRGHAMLLYLS